MPEIKDPSIVQRIQPAPQRNVRTLGGVPSSERRADEDQDFERTRIGIAAGNLALQQRKFEADQAKDAGLTPAEEAIDKKFADEFVEWTVGGGFADFQKQSEQLRGAIAELGRSDGVSGPIVGRLPDFVNQAVGNSEAITVREDVEEVVQRNLRLILGAQFTEKEGERLISRAFNPTLDEAENKKRVVRLLKQMQAAAQAKSEAAEYFREHGTLKGWGGRLPTLSDFDPERKDKAKTSEEDEALIRKYLD